MFRRIDSTAWTHIARQYLTPIALVVALLVGGVSTDALGNDKERLDRLASQILEEMQSFYPVRASELGNREYDHRFTDFGSKAVKNHIRALKNFEKELKKFKDADLTPADWVNVKLLHSDIASSRYLLDERDWHKKSPLLYVDEAVNGLYTLMVTDSAVPQERLYAIVKRLEGTPALFSTARRNLTKPPQLLVDLALSRLESAQRFYQAAGGELMRQYPDRADEMLRKTTRAREAMNDFAVYLTGLTPGDNKELALGSDDFEQVMAERYFLPLKVDTLLTFAQDFLFQAKDDYQRYLEYVVNDHQNGKDSVFVPASFTRDDILDYYQWETGQVRIFLEETDLVGVPEDLAALRVIETPGFLREVVPGTHYQPLSDSLALIYVRPIPEPLEERQLAARYRYVHRRGFTSTVIQQVYPGRHLQLQLGDGGESQVRSWQRSPMMLEGWQLFCGQFSNEAGVYGSEAPAVWLAILKDQHLAAAMAVAEIHLHTEAKSFADCVAWLAETVNAETESERQYLRSRFQQAVMDPGTCLTPVFGKAELTRLREVALSQDNDIYADRDFYDLVLKQGAIPPPLLWEALELGVRDMAGL